jgi:hypothetical protein
MPDVDDDIRLHFSFWCRDWEGAAAARKQALAFLPCGEAILTRIESHLATRRAPISREEAESILRDGLAEIRTFGLECADPSDPVRLIDGSVPLLDAFAAADTPFVHLFDELSARALGKYAHVRAEAYYFLSEPLYQLESAYEVANWAMWPLHAPSTTGDLTEAPYGLWQGGWSPGWDAQGLFLYRRHDLV